MKVSYPFVHCLSSDLETVRISDETKLTAFFVLTLDQLVPN